MLKKMTTNSKGFTLIELMIVVAIIGILAAIAIPQFSSYRVRAYNSAAISDLKSFQTALEVYYNDNDEYPASVDTTTDTIKTTVTEGEATTTLVNLSKNVQIKYDGTDTQAYKAFSKHKAGDKTYIVTTKKPTITDSSSTKGADLEDLADLADLVDEG